MNRRDLLTGAGLCALAFPASATLPNVLARPALTTALAPTAAMLAVTRTGLRLVAGGERGLVVFSDDDGRTWQQARVPVQVSITSLVFADERRGWATGHFGVVLQTLDGGQTWAQQLNGERVAQQALKDAADDAQRRTAQALLDDGPDKPLFDVALNGSEGLIAVGAFGLAVASRDGAAWQSIGHRLPNPKQLHLYAVKTVGERVFVVGEQGLLLRSTDRGATFEAISSPYNGSFFGLLVTRKGTLLAHGLRGSLFRSTDGGESWGQVNHGVAATLCAGIERPDGALLLLASQGDLLISRDDGHHFEHIPSKRPFPASDLAPASGQTIVLAGLRGLQRQELA